MGGEPRSLIIALWLTGRKYYRRADKLTPERVRVLRTLETDDSSAGLGVCFPPQADLPAKAARWGQADRAASMGRLAVSAVRVSASPPPRPAYGPSRSLFEFPRADDSRAWALATVMRPHIYLGETVADVCPLSGCWGQWARGNASYLHACVFGRSAQQRLALGGFIFKVHGHRKEPLSRASRDTRRSISSVTFRQVSVSGSIVHTATAD